MGDLNLDPRVATAIMLIELGVVTVERIKEYFTQNGDDDEVLAAILTEVNARLERRK